MSPAASSAVTCRSSAARNARRRLLANASALGDQSGLQQRFLANAPDGEKNPLRRQPVGGGNHAVAATLAASCVAGQCASRTLPQDRSSRRACLPTLVDAVRHIHECGDALRINLATWGTNRKTLISDL